MFVGACESTGGTDGSRYWEWTAEPRVVSSRLDERGLYAIVSSGVAYDPYVLTCRVSGSDIIVDDRSALVRSDGVTMTATPHVITNLVLERYRALAPTIGPGAILVSNGELHLRGEGRDVIAFAISSDAGTEAIPVVDLYSADDLASPERSLRTIVDAAGNPERGLLVWIDGDRGLRYALRGSPWTHGSLGAADASSSIASISDTEVLVAHTMDEELTLERRGIPSGQAIGEVRRFPLPAPRLSPFQANGRPDGVVRLALRTRAGFEVVSIDGDALTVVHRDAALGDAVAAVHETTGEVLFRDAEGALRLVDAEGDLRAITLPPSSCTGVAAIVDPEACGPFECVERRALVPSGTGAAAAVVYHAEYDRGASLARLELTSAPVERPMTNSVAVRVVVHARDATGRELEAVVATRPPASNELVNQDVTVALGVPTTRFTLPHRGGLDDAGLVLVLRDIDGHVLHEEVVPLADDVTHATWVVWSRDDGSFASRLWDERGSSADVDVQAVGWLSASHRAAHGDLYARWARVVCEEAYCNDPACIAFPDGATSLTRGGLFLMPDALFAEIGFGTSVGTPPAGMCDPEAIGAVRRFEPSERGQRYLAIIDGAAETPTLQWLVGGS